jgi:Flp pilus assembly protein TadG
MVEFTLVFPVLAILLFGVIQFGIAFNNYLAVTDAVRAGARQAAVSRYLPAANREATVEQKVKDSAGDLDESKLNVDVTDGAGGTPSWDPGSDVTVTATYPYSISLLGVVVKSGDLKSETTERVE